MRFPPSYQETLLGVSQNSAVIFVVPSAQAARGLYAQCCQGKDNSRHNIAWATLTSESYPYDRRAVWAQWAAEALEGLIVTPEILLHPDTSEQLRGRMSLSSLQMLFPDPRHVPYEWPLTAYEWQRACELSEVLSDSTYPLAQCFKSISWLQELPTTDRYHIRLHPVFSDAFKWRKVAFNLQGLIEGRVSTLLLLSKWPPEFSPLAKNIASCRDRSVRLMSDVWSSDWGEEERLNVTRLLLFEAVVSTEELTFITSFFPALTDIDVYCHVSDCFGMKRRRQRLGCSRGVMSWQSVDLGGWFWLKPVLQWL
jgi:hypothetical protein